MSELSILNCLEYPNWDRDKNIIQNLVDTTKSTQSAINDFDTSEMSKEQILGMIGELTKMKEEIEGKKNELITIGVSELESKNSGLELNESAFKNWINTNEWKISNPKKVNKIIIHHLNLPTGGVSPTSNAEYIKGIDFYYSDESSDDINNYGTSSETTTTLDLTNGEYLTGIEFNYTEGTPVIPCKQIKLYTNFSGGIPIENGKIPNIEFDDESNIKYTLNPVLAPMPWHFFNARVSNKNLANPKNKDQYIAVFNEINKSSQKHAWLGIMRFRLYNDLMNLYTTSELTNSDKNYFTVPNESQINNGYVTKLEQFAKIYDNKKNRFYSGSLTPKYPTNDWRYSDGTNHSYSEFQLNQTDGTYGWNRNEPNNHSSGEAATVMFKSGNKYLLNDARLAHKAPAVYEEIISSNITNKSASYNEQIYSIDSFDPLEVTIESTVIEDEFGKNASQTIYKVVEDIRNNNLQSIDDIQEMYRNYEIQQDEIDRRLTELESRLKLLDELYTIGDDALSSSHQGFTNLRNNDKNMNLTENIFKNILKSLNNIMPGKLIEGNTNNDRFHVGVNTVFDNTDNAAGEMLTYMDNLRDRETKKHVGELLIKRNNLFTNTVMDYMIHNDRGTDINKVYNKVKQKNINTNRQVGINMYYSKMYKEYINIIKVIIVACALVIPVLILNSNYIIPKNITIFLVTVLIVFLVGFIIYKIYDLNYRDYKNFDKIKIPYDREAERMIREGKLDEFENPLLGNLTCIADSCCDVSMVYDSERNKCVMEDKIVENFLGENFNNKESFVNRNNFKCDIVQDLLSTSLASSTPIDMNNNLIKQGLDIEFSG